MFAGLFSREAPLAAWGAPERLGRALLPLAATVTQDVWHSGPYLLVQAAADAASAMVFRHDSGLAVAFWGRLDNREALRAALAVAPGLCDAGLVAQAWLRWHAACPEHLVGDFAFAVASPRTGELLLARDVMGVKPLLYRIGPEGVAFASSAAAFGALALGTLTRDRDWMAKYLLGLSASHTDTAFREVRKLPGAHSLLLQADGRSQLRRYHRFVDDAPRAHWRDPQWLEAYRACWQEAVRCRTPAHGAVASENSGGIDSGSITAELARQLGPDSARLHAMGYCQMAREPEYIMATAMAAGLRHNYLVADDRLGEFAQWRGRELAQCGYPNEHPNAVYHAVFYRYCREQGIDTLFSGFGGDEAVTCEWQRAGAEFARAGDWRGLWRVLPRRWPGRLPRFARECWRARRPLPAPGPAGFAQAAWPWRDILHPELLQDNDWQQGFLHPARFQGEFTGINDYVLSTLDEAYIPIRLETCSQLAAGHGIDYVWPLWDARLVQQWLSTPAIWKTGDGGETRYLHRMAVRGVCPDKVAGKPDKDMGFAALQRRYDAEDLRPSFEALRREADTLPAELAAVVDAGKLKRMADYGLRHACSGGDILHACNETLELLSDLRFWCEHEPTPEALRSGD